MTVGGKYEKGEKEGERDITYIHIVTGAPKILISIIFSAKYVLVCKEGTGVFLYLMQMN